MRTDLENATSGIQQKYPVYLLTAWTALIILSVIWNIYQNHQDTHAKALIEAKTYYELNLAYRKWGSMLGGVYASVDKVTPNPYLIVPERDVTTTDGKRLTLLNPAYMTRMVFELIKSKSDLPVVNSKLTSLKSLNPDNTPDEWERKALLSFEQGKKEANLFTYINGIPYLRFIKPFVTEESCLRCHGNQGYKAGDIRGGISFDIPLRPYYDSEAKTRNIIILSHIFLWLIVSWGIFVFSKKQKEALDKIRILQGFIPICASCKKIRDDKGFWNQMEAYISNHSEAEFSHGICPECQKKLYPEFFKDKE